MTNLSVISPKEAKARGAVRYFTGKPCKNGHIAERSLANGTCFGCKSISDARYYSSNSEAIIARVSSYAEENRDELLAKARERGRINRNHIVANKKIWRANNIEHVRLKGRVYAENRRCRLLKADGFHTSEEVSELAKVQKYKCAGCKTSIKELYEEDHIMPLSLGGSNWISNIQLLCPTCNRRKHAKHPIVWAQENGRLL